MAARRVAFDGEPLVAAIQATFRRRGTPLPEAEMVGLSDVVEELRRFLQKPFAAARSGDPFSLRWNPSGPWS